MPHKYDVPLEAETFYHVYNRANGQDLLYRNAEDYNAFLKRVHKYLVPHMAFYAYCLIPNHFHFFIRTSLPGSPTPLSKAFSDCFNSYSKWYNKRYERKGSLFQTPFRRKCVSDEAYFTQIIFYIHRNPIHHRLAQRMEDWPYSSYPALISEKATLLKRDEVLEWFSGKERFVQYHLNIRNDYLSSMNGVADGSWT